MRRHCRLLIRVPSRSTARIQEVHLLVGHILCQLVDDVFAKRRAR
jgi:D-sedoheptulose 7-phosphate isomerase